MPPKAPSAGKSKPIDDDEDVFQAVILAESFNDRFKPLTLQRPRCLLPICNAPLLDWTFESLALAGAHEIFVVCRSHAELVKAAIKKSRWSQPTSGIKVVPIVTAKETYSAGDALRDIYTHGIITTDFVLVYGDLVSNIRIDAVVQAHKERRRTNKDAIMTIVVKESGVRHRTRSRGDSAVFVLDADTSECLHYEPVTGFPPTKIVHVPREVLVQHPELEIRNDVIDCNIDVCSVEVPSLFQDNFDYQDVRRDFVRGVLTSDLLMKNIYCYVAKQGYAARVKDTRSYDAVSKDILARWTFPLTPDNNYPGDQIYEHSRGNKYIPSDNTVVLSRTCKVGMNTMIGSSTRIHDNAEINASVVGKRCTIGEGSIIRNSYIFNDVVVEANCVIECSIVGEGVKIKEDSIIQTGCLIGDGVVLGPAANLAPFERVLQRGMKSDQDEDEERSELEEAELNQPSQGIELGKDSNAIVWPRGSPEEDEDPESVENFRNLRLMRIGDDALDLNLSDAGSITSSEDENETTSDEADVRHLGSMPSSSATSLPHNVPALDVPSAAAVAESEFRAEVELSLQRAFAEGHSVENAAVELKTLRMASNVPLRRVREAVVAAVVEQIRIVHGGVVVQRQETARVVSRWGKLIDLIGGVDAVETISVLQNHCASSERLPLFGQILAALYQDDLVEEDDIRKWYDEPESRGEGSAAGSVKAENLRKCWAIGGRMIEQFDEQDSDDSE